MSTRDFHRKKRRAARCDHAHVSPSQARKYRRLGWTKKPCRICGVLGWSRPKPKADPSVTVIQPLPGRGPEGRMSDRQPARFRCVVYRCYRVPVAVVREGPRSFRTCLLHLCRQAAKDRAGPEKP